MDISLWSSSFTRSCAALFALISSQALALNVKVKMISRKKGSLLSSTNRWIMDISFVQTEKSVLTSLLFISSTFNSHHR